MTLQEQIAYLERYAPLSSSEMHRQALAEIKNSLENLNGYLAKDLGKYRLHNAFVSVYRDFAQDRCVFVMDTRSGKALKEIIAKLLKIKNVDTEEQALEAFELIFDHWNSLSDFLQSMVTLPSINKYLIEILDSLKNGNYKTKQQNSSAKSAVKNASIIAKRRRG